MLTLNLKKGTSAFIFNEDTKETMEIKFKDWHTRNQILLKFETPPNWKVYREALFRDIEDVKSST